MGYIELVVRREGRFSRLLARKRLHSHFRADGTFRSMLLEEARLAALVRHPNVTTVLEVGEDESGPFFLMEYVEGPSVAQILECVEPRDRLLPVALGVSIVAQAARGLHAAHQLVSPEGVPLGVVHRDISPKNLLVGYDGLVRVADFGIAKAKDNLEQTRIGVLKGNVGYMAPEYLRFQELDCRSDLFALGVVLYELLARERLYAGNDTGAIARRILEEPPPDIFEIRDVPPELTGLLFELLAKDRELRPPNALAVAAELDAIAASIAAVDGPFDLGAFLEEELSELRNNQRDKVNAALSVPPLAPAPARSADLASEPRLRLDRGRHDPASDESTTSSTEAHVAALARPPRRWLAGLVATSLLAGTLLTFGLSSRLFREGTPLTGPADARLWAGGWHTCAMRAQRLECWGGNQKGQLGDGTDQTRLVPLVVELAGVRSAALGELHSCALAETGRVWCWGRNMKGESGLEEISPLNHRPMEVAGLEGVTELAAGRQHTCALTASGDVFCWGANHSGQLGRTPFAEPGRLERVEALPPAKRIFAGGANTCARVRSGGLLCWGANESGQLDPGSREARPLPAPIPGIEDLVTIGFGNNGRAGSANPDLSKVNSFACGLTPRGTVLCWGSNYTGQLGDGTREDRLGPTQVLDVVDAIDLDVGNVHACALERSGRVWCWGRNEFGNVGDGTMGPSNVRPRAALVADLDDVVGLSLGDAHTCARRRQGDIACFGVNNFGQLGDGTLLLRPSPISVSGFP